MSPVTVSIELLLAMAAQLAIIVAAFVWVQAGVRSNSADLRTIKKALGLGNGTEPAFVRTSMCVLMEKEVDRRLGEVQEQVGDAAQKADHAVAVARAESDGIQKRLAAVELTLQVLAKQ